MRRSCCFVLALTLGACRTEDASPGGGVPTASAPPAQSVAKPSSDAHAAHDCSTHANPEPNRGTSATHLQPSDVSLANVIRVSAHVGGVLLRKQAGEWISVGKRRCSVPSEQVTRALTNLTSLTVGQKLPSWPADMPFDLQIDVLRDDEALLHFELSPRRGKVDVVQLSSGDVFEIGGLDRAVWSSDASAWCLPVSADADQRF